jgi:hypothetical protein
MSIPTHPLTGQGVVVLPAHIVPAFFKILAVLVLVVEMLLVGFAVAQGTWSTVLAGHAAIVALLVLTLVLAERSGIDTSDLQKFAFLTACGGPVGAAAAMISINRSSTVQMPILDKWYRTIAPPEEAAVTLVDQIIDGRLVRMDSLLPRRFDELLASGSMVEKQAILAYLANEDTRSGVSEALRLAMRSPDQRVRVQAAAVAAHGRDKARHALMASVLAAQAIKSDQRSAGVSLLMPPVALQSQTMRS